MDKYPHVPAAFINAIADEGTKNSAIEYLQKTWNELCAMRAALRRMTPEPKFCSRPDECAGKNTCQRQFDTGYCCNH